MWPFKKKEIPLDQNQLDYQNFQNNVINNNSNSIPNQQFQSQSNNQVQDSIQQNQPKEKNIYIQKDKNGYAIILYAILLIGFIIYFIFLK